MQKTSSVPEAKVPRSTTSPTSRLVAMRRSGPGEQSHSSLVSFASAIRISTVTVPPMP